jgi:hypothetical protein
MEEKKMFNVDMLNVEWREEPIFLESRDKNKKMLIDEC